MKQYIWNFDLIFINVCLSDLKPVLAGRFVVLNQCNSGLNQSKRPKGASNTTVLHCPLIFEQLAIGYFRVHFRVSVVRGKARKFSLKFIPSFILTFVGKSFTKFCEVLYYL